MPFLFLFILLLHTLATFQEERMEKNITWRKLVESQKWQKAFIKQTLKSNKDSLETIPGIRLFQQKNGLSQLEKGKYCNKSEEKKTKMTLNQLKDYNKTHQQQKVLPPKFIFSNLKKKENFVKDLNEFINDLSSHLYFRAVELEVRSPG